MLYQLELELLIKFMVQLALLMSMDSILQQEDCGHGELEYGSGSEWAKLLGEKAISNGSEKFWPSITQGNLDL